MKRIHYNPIINLLISGGAALILALLGSSLLTAASKPAQANGAPEHAHPSIVEPPGLVLQFPKQQAVPISTLAAITSTPELSGPATVLELFFGPEAAPPPGGGDISPASLEPLLRPAGDGELEAAAGGRPLLGPSIFSSAEITAGTYSMDWGDVDRDGDLDLAIGSTNGTAVYRNGGPDNPGELTLVWTDTTYTLGVRWADVGDEPNLELIAVGDSSYFYIYWTPEVSNSKNLYFSGLQLFRIAPGYYGNDGDIDLMMSTTDLGSSCPVRLYYGPFVFSCVSDEGTASLSAADFDNNGTLDLALGLHQSKEIRVVINTGTLSVINSSILVDSSLAHIPYDFSWGDYDRDGYLDLAAAFPLEQEVRIYHNNDGTFPDPATPIIISTGAFLTPLAVDWADFDGDGWLELAVADLPPRLYQYDGASFTELASLPGITGRIQDIRGLDLDNDADLDLALANQFGPNQVFQTNAPPLSPTLMVVDSDAAQSVAWGDANDDGFLDLLLGGGLYTYDNTNGNFTSSTIPGQGLAFGDVDGDSQLEVALDAGSQYGIMGVSPLWYYSSSANPKSLAWGYINSHDKLDLLLGNDNNRLNLAFLSDESFSLADSSIWESTESETTYSLAWADYNQDLYLDFAVANGSAGSRIYRNNKNNTFSPIWHTPGNARSVAWADYNGDTWPDLAVGYYGAANHIYQNQNGSGAFASSWNSGSDTGQTTGLAWGDLDNDGDFDLAVGNDNGQDQVYANLGSPTAPNLALLWESTEISATTAVAWGDKDGDGDLDLAISSGSGGGVYENNFVLPAHLDVTTYTQYMPLPRNPSYVSIGRPGKTADAYFFSSAEIMAGYLTPTVSISYKLFDPDGDPIVQNKTIYEFSLDGGGTWDEATPSSGSPVPSGDTSRQGDERSFVWDARKDQAISDNARFRITIVHQKPTGPVQRASSRAVSPPFRVRAVECIWPTGPSIQILNPEPPENPKVNELTRFLGLLEEGSGALNFVWDFGDGSITKTAQLVHRRYEQAGPYTITLTVKGEPCPFTLDAVVTKSIVVEDATGKLGSDAQGARGIYLPLILKSVAGEINLGLPAQITGLQGSIQPNRGATHLAWRPSQAAGGYRIYRGSRAATDEVFQLLATVPANAHSYTDQTAACGQMYYVTAFNALGESLPSTASYFSPPCQ